jgi:hypothetical protein
MALIVNLLPANLVDIDHIKIVILKFFFFLQFCFIFKKLNFKKEVKNIQKLC